MGSGTDFWGASRISLDQFHLPKDLLLQKMTMDQSNTIA